MDGMGRSDPSGVARLEQLERGVLDRVPRVLPEEHQQARAAVPWRDEVGHVHLEQPVRQVLLRPALSHGEGGLPPTIQSRPQGKKRN